MFNFKNLMDYKLQRDVFQQIDAVGERPFRSLRDLNDYTNSLLDLANHHMARSFAAETRRYKRGI